MTQRLSAQAALALALAFALAMASAHAPERLCQRPSRVDVAPALARLAVGQKGAFPTLSRPCSGLASLCAPVHVAVWQAAVARIYHLVVWSADDRASLEVAASCCRACGSGWLPCAGGAPLVAVHAPGCARCVGMTTCISSSVEIARLFRASSSTFPQLTKLRMAQRALIVHGLYDLKCATCAQVYMCNNTASNQMSRHIKGAYPISVRRLSSR